MPLTRRQLLAGAGAAALGAGGIYELVDRLTAPPARAIGPPPKLPLEQHVLEGVRIVRDNGVEVLVPPLHHEVVTAAVRARDLKAAQRELEGVLADLDR